MSTPRIYLGARDLATPEKAAARTREVIADWESVRVKTALGTHFRYTSRVELVRPWWMPAWLYGRLMRSIVVENQAEEKVRS